MIVLYQIQRKNTTESKGRLDKQRSGGFFALPQFFENRGWVQRLAPVFALREVILVCQYIFLNCRGHGKLDAWLVYAPLFCKYVGKRYNAL